MKLETRFGKYGGCYAPESLIPNLQEVEKGFIEVQKSKSFLHELDSLLKNYAGRETPLTFAESLSSQTGCDIFLKREDLLHGGAHKTNNTLGQLLLAKHLGKKRI
ncbi:MAG: tryptophan synthase beta chain, partial [Francisellaceae bacterium]